ncbi:ribosomal peptide maturation radical SAM protein 1 [Actinosynnema pretiosum]|nr:ribosomal peptide maturation radical SAM protein 1 [Actinosynnema pretiosum]
MPWNNVYRPSIQVGTLRSVAEAEGWEVVSDYAYLSFYALGLRSLGLSPERWAAAYERVSEGLYHLSVGDWIYARRLDGAEECAEYYGLLRAKGVAEEEVRLVEALRPVADRHVAQTAEGLLRVEPDVIGFTTTFSQNGPTLAVARRLRESGYAGVIVLGGSNCEGPMGRTLLANFPDVDAVVDGPGEDAFVALLRQVAGGGPLVPTGRLVVRDGGTSGGVGGAVRRALPGPVAAEGAAERLEVPRPNYDGFFEQLRAVGLDLLEPDITLPVEFSRGCWWGAKTHCTFCGLNGATMAYRSKHPDSVADELKHMMDRYGVLDFFAVDNILDLGYFDTALPELERLRTDHSLFFEVKANMDWAQLRAARRAGVRSVQPGIESLSTEGLRALKKGATAFQNVRFLLGCAEFGVLPVWNILTGYPGETPASLLTQLNLVASLTHLEPPDADVLAVHFDRFSPYVETPGTFGLTLSRPFPGYRFAYPGLSPAELWDIAYHFEGEFADDERNAALRERLAARVRVWKARHREARFEYRLGFASVGLVDRRPGLPRADVVLGGDDARLFRAVIGGARFRDLQALGWVGDRWEPALERLRAWQRRRWVLVEGTKVIALAVRASPSAHRRPPAQGTPRRARAAVPVTLTPPGVRT